MTPMDRHLRLLAREVHVGDLLCEVARDRLPVPRPVEQVAVCPAGVRVRFGRRWWLLPQVEQVTVLRPAGGAR